MKFGRNWVWLGPEDKKLLFFRPFDIISNTFGSLLLATVYKTAVALITVTKLVIGVIDTKSKLVARFFVTDDQFLASIKDIDDYCVTSFSEKNKKYESNLSIHLSFQWHTFNFKRIFANCILRVSLIPSELSRKYIWKDQRRQSVVDSNWYVNTGSRIFRNTVL